MKSVHAALVLLLSGISAAPPSAFAQPANGVIVTTDAPSYASGDPIDVTITNTGPDRITRGGLDCDDLWPLALEEQDANGDWQPYQPPRHGCIGVAGVIVAPGQTQDRTITVPLDPGTYHVVYAFSDVDDGNQYQSFSDPFDVTPAH